MSWLFALCACMSIVAVVLICVFLFANGIPAMKEIGFFNFLFGTKWAPKNEPARKGESQKNLCYKDIVNKKLGTAGRRAESSG